MQSVNDLGTIKKKVYLAYFEDGIWDILLGTYLLGWSISIFFDLVAVMGGVWVAAYFSALGLKRAIVYPRSGYIKISEARKLQLRMVILGIVLFIGGLFIYLLFSMGNRPDWLADYFMLMLGSVMAGTVALLGYWWRITRWYWYAAIMMAGFIVQQWTPAGLEYGFLVPGGIILLSGIVLFITFLRRYPKKGNESDIDIVSRSGNEDRENRL